MCILGIFSGQKQLLLNIKFRGLDYGFNVFYDSINQTLYKVENFDKAHIALFLFAKEEK